MAARRYRRVLNTATGKPGETFISLEREINMNTGHKHHQSDAGSGRFRWGLLAAIGVILYFLLTEHKAHFIGFLPYLLLVACMLIHVFMHGGHGDHGAGTDDPNDREKKGNGHG
jgi:hypothetical protein